MPIKTHRPYLTLLSSLVSLTIVSLASAQEMPTSAATAPPETPKSPGKAAEEASAPEDANEAQETGPTTVTETAEAPVQEAVPVALPPAPAGSGGIAVFPVVATNLTEGESTALGVLFASEIRDEKRGRVIQPGVASEYSSGPLDYQSAAAHMNVDQYIAIEAVRLDRTTIVTATLHRRDGSVVETAKMSAKSVDDFQFVSERLAVALLQGKPLEKTRTLDNVTEEEADGNNRTFVEKVFGFKTSFIVPYSEHVDLPTMVGASFDGRLEGKSYFLEFGAGLLLPASSYDDSVGYGGVFAEIGGSYYLTHTNVSPYIGAGVMPRILSTQPANLAVYGQAGVMFFRTSSSRLYAELRVAQNLTPMELVDYSIADELESGEVYRMTARPIEFGLNVGLGW